MSEPITIGGVGMPATLWLDEFGSHLWSAFGKPGYLVGSALRNKRDFRDVDIRMILDDAQFEKDGYGQVGSEHTNGKWVAMCLAFSELGKRMTGLNIDFQIQQQSEANRLYRSPEHPRSAIGLVGLRYATSIKQPQESKPLVCEACIGLGWLHTNVGNDREPKFEIQRCDTCKKYENDEAARSEYFMAGVSLRKVDKTRENYDSAVYDLKKDDPILLGAEVRRLGLDKSKLYS